MNIIFLLQNVVSNGAVADSLNAANGLMNGEATELSVTLLSLVMKGGWIMVILGILSIIADHKNISVYQ